MNRCGGSSPTVFRWIFILLALTVFMWASTVSGEVPEVSGTITSDTTWSGTVSVTGDVTVAHGITLTLSPGTLVQFVPNDDDQSGGSHASRTELIVHGSLVAEGTEALPIRFISAADSAVAGDWYGIRVIADQRSEQVSLSHCEIAHAHRGLHLEAAGHRLDVVVNECELHDSAEKGVYLYSHSANGRLEGTLSGNQIHDNAGHGVHLDGRSGGDL
ncbi:MAG: right-handed parallel beta-helix repeat-containing protein, partial [Gammaproteobacteria bacterium]|nr:right-handed parallel beta-helix repeat-containing protein [Gammaproteobacteria bacterium]